MLWKVRLPLAVSSDKAAAPVLRRGTLFCSVTLVTPDPVMALAPLVVMSSELTVAPFASTIARLFSAKAVPWPAASGWA